MDFTQFITHLFDDSFASRWAGTCHGWTKELVIGHVIADTLIWISFMIIPVFLIKGMSKNKQTPLNGIFLLFAAFIVTCGLTHLVAVITPFAPLYYADFWVKTVAAIVSVASAVVLCRNYKQFGNVTARIEALEQIAVEKEQLVVEAKEEKEQLAVKAEGLAVEALVQKQNFDNEIREKQDFFKQLGDNIPQLAWMAEPNGYIYWYNQRWYDYTGTDFDDMKGWGWQSVHDPEILPDVMREWQESIEQCKPFNMIFPLKAKDGTFHPFLTLVMPFRDQQGNVVHWFGTNTDITAQKDVEAKLRELIAVNKELQDFALVAAHDLQDPLKQNTVFLKLIQSGKTEFMPEMEKNNKRMQAFIGKLLEFARSGGNNINIQTSNLNEVIANVLTDLDAFIKEHNAEVVAGDMPIIQCDPVEISRVFQNLIKNAINAKGDHTPQVKIHAQRRPHAYLFTVTDNGVGVDPSSLPNLFTVFRGKKNDSTGAGFGLAICKRIVESHGGMIAAVLNPEKGITIAFTVPYKI